MLKFSIWKAVVVVAGAAMLRTVYCDDPTNLEKPQDIGEFDGSGIPYFQPSEVQLNQEDAEEYEGIDDALDILNSRICDIDSRLENMRRSIQASVLSFGEILNSDDCEVIHEGRCFEVVVADSPRDLLAGEQLCSNLGWELGNIYSMEHFALIENHIRSKQPTEQRRIKVWTGMIKDRESGMVRTTSGREMDSSNYQWHNGEEEQISEGDSVVISVSVAGDADALNGLAIFDETRLLDGALCEL